MQVDVQHAWPLHTGNHPNGIPVLAIAPAWATVAGTGPSCDDALTTYKLQLCAHVRAASVQVGALDSVTCVSRCQTSVVGRNGWSGCVGAGMADFDLKKLERELETAVEVEEKRQRVDDCKKQAIHSTASYEEFRQVRAQVGTADSAAGGSADTVTVLCGATPASACC